MPRVKGGTVARARRKKYLQAAKGYFGSKHRLFKTAKEQVNHSSVYAYRDRKQTKRNFRKLWIIRINAACRENEISYSRFINGLEIAGIDINRKMLSEIAISDPKTFTSLVKSAKEAIKDPEKARANKEKTVKIEKTTVKKAVEKVTEVAEKETPVKKTTTVKKATVKAEPKKETVKKVAAKTAVKKPTVKKSTAKKETK